MGKIFELIADEALEKLDDYYKECHVCDRTDVDLYKYHGELKLDDGEIDNDIYAVCADCILTKDLNHINDVDYVSTIENYLSKSGLDANETEARKKLLTEKYQKTPDIPMFMQYDDRPLCCKDIAEFVGRPRNSEELYAMTESTIYWEGQAKEKSDLYDFRKTGDSESFNDVASFRCNHCGKQYFTFQFT